MGKIPKRRFLCFSSALLASLLALSGATATQARPVKERAVLAPVVKASEKAVSPDEAKIIQNLNYGNIPLYFVPNRGQVNEIARFYARASHYTLWLTAEGLVFDRSVSTEKPGDRSKPWDRGETRDRVGNLPRESLRGEVRNVAREHGEELREENPRAEPMRSEHWQGGDQHKKGLNKEAMPSENRQEKGRLVEMKREVHRLVFVGANPEPEIEGEGGTGHIANYFIGSDPAKWRTNIATSRGAVYREIYPNIDVKVYGIERQIEYDWLVRPGGDPQAIDFAYEDVLGTELDAEGDLIIRTELGEFRHRKPIAHQATPDGSSEPIEARFRTIGRNHYGFTVGSYDRSRPLIIDPVVLVYSTYLGGNSYDTGYGIAVDSSGCAYVTGSTSSTDFPTRNAFLPIRQGTGPDAFVTKLTAAGNDLIYSSYLGGGAARGISVDGSGCAYVTGETSSVDFPTRNPFQANNRGRSDGFVTKLSDGGNDLVYSTYLGGSDSDYAFGLAVDGSSCAYVAGRTQSADFPTRNSFQANNQGPNDAFVTKLSAAGNALEYSTYLGGTGSDVATGIFVDRSGCAYVTGGTGSADFPTRNPFQASHHGFGDCFLTKFSPAGNDVIYSTYLGGKEDDYGPSISVDPYGCAYVSGSTCSPDFPTRNPFQAKRRGGDPEEPDVFVTKLAPGGNDLVYSTYLGGTFEDFSWGIAVDNSGYAYITGYTYSRDFPIWNAFQAQCRGETDVFVTKLSKSGNVLAYSTYLGGSTEVDTIYVGRDCGYGFAIDNSGCVYVTGVTFSGDYPTRNPFQANKKNKSDAFVTKLNATYTVTALVSGGHGTASPATQTIATSGVATININPDHGYHIGSITDNGISVAVNNPYVISDVQEDHAVIVKFANEPPTVKIVSPVAGAKVFGVVPVTAEATDDSRVSKVVFYIDSQPLGDDTVPESDKIYSQSWDTRSYGYGTHWIQAVAYDEAGLSRQDEISVMVEQVALALQGERLTERAWILRKPFVRLTVAIQNRGQVSVDKFVIYRKTGTGDYEAVKELTFSEASGPSFVWDDTSIGKDTQYGYRVVALRSGGVVLGVSDDIAL